MALLFMKGRSVKRLSFLQKSVMRNRSEAFKQLRFGFMGVKKSKKRTIANHRIMHIVAARDPALARFEKSHKALQVIIGARKAIDIVTSEEAPPETAKDFINVSSNRVVDGVHTPMWQLL